jgi:hypothetical protein
MPKHAIHKRKITAFDTTRLRPHSRPFLIWDTLQRGLALQVRPSRHRAYKFVYRFGGRSRWITLAAADAISLARAREISAELALEVIRGNDPAATRSPTPGSPSAPTFGAIAQRYVAEYSQRRNKSWRQADRLLHRHVLPSWASLSASAITRADVRTMIGAIAAPIAANQTLAATSAIFSWAIKQELLGETLRRIQPICVRHNRRATEICAGA